MKNHIHNYLLAIISALFRPVKVPEELQKICNELAHTVLITQSPSLVIEGLIKSFAARLGFKTVRRLERKDFIELISKPDSSLEGLSWASMHDINSLPWPSDFENSTNKSLKLRTLNVFQVKGPIRKWPSFKPSIFWLWGLIPTRRILTVTIGEKIDFHQHSAERLLRLIKIDFIRTLKLVRGTPFVPREEQARSILSGPEYEREIRIISERSAISLAEGKRRANKAFFELAANPRRFMYDALSIVARILLSRLFSEIHTRGLERLIPAIKDHTVILVPMHRSHLDYVLVGYKLFSEKVNPPLVAAGINLAFWPFGFLFRSVGAYFVKRNARDRFHTIVLKRYVSYLVTHGHLQEFFIEGGRSRSGKMLPPKLGLLSTIVDSWKPERARDILFVPVSITYENVVEDESFSSENSGGAKVRESIGSTIRAFDVFRKRYGEVIIEFGKPISNRAFRAGLESSSAGRTSNKQIAQDLGYSLCRAIRNQINPGLTSLCYTYLLMANRYGMSKSQLQTGIITLHSYLEILRANGFAVGTDTPQLARFVSGNHDTLIELANAGVVSFERHFSEDYFYIPGKRRFTADYYKNSVLHYFFNLSLLSLCCLLDGKITESRQSRIFAYFEHDLILESWPVFRQQSQSLAGILAASGILIKGATEYSFNPDKISYFIPGLLSSHLQAYYWVSRFLLSAVTSSEQEGDSLTYEGFISNLLSSAKLANYLGILSRTEATARSSIISIISSLESRGLIRLGEGSKSDRAILVPAEQRQQIQCDIDLLSEINLALNKWILENG